MQFNILYGKHENLINFPLEEGNLYVTNKGYVYLDTIKNNKLTRLCIVDKANWQAESNTEGHIENRTHWCEQIYEPVLPSTTETQFWEEGHILVQNNFDDEIRQYLTRQLFPGEKYRIIIDNVTYELKAYTLPSPYNNYTILGDSRLLSHIEFFDEDFDNINPENVPFVIAHIISCDSLNLYTYNYISELSIFMQEESTIQIDKILGFNYIPLEEEYIPDSIARVDQLPKPDWQENNSESINYIQNRSHWYGPLVEWQQQYNIVSRQYGSDPFEIQEGTHSGTYSWNRYPYEAKEIDNWIIEYDGKTYSCTSFFAAEYDEAYFIGNSLLHQESDIMELNPNDLPFLLSWTCEDTGVGIYWRAFWTLYTNDDNPTPHTVKIGLQTKKDGYNKLDFNYLPSISWSQLNPDEYSRYILLAPHITERTHYYDYECDFIFQDVDINSFPYRMSFQSTGFQPKYVAVILDDISYYSNYVYTHLNEDGDEVWCCGDSRLLLTPEIDENGSFIYNNDGSLKCKPDMSYPRDVPFAIECREDTMHSLTSDYQYAFVCGNNRPPKKISLGVTTNNSMYHKLDEEYMPDEAASKSYIAEEVTKIIGGKY